MDWQVFRMRSVAGGDVSNRGRRLPVPYQVMITTALEQLPGKKGSTEEVRAAVEDTQLLHRPLSSKFEDAEIFLFTAHYIAYLTAVSIS